MVGIKGSETALADLINFWRPWGCHMWGWMQTYEICWSWEWLWRDDLVCIESQKQDHKQQQTGTDWVNRNFIMGVSIYRIESKKFNRKIKYLFIDNTKTEELKPKSARAALSFFSHILVTEIWSEGPHWYSPALRCDQARVSPVNWEPRLVSILTEAANC